MKLMKCIFLLVVSLMIKKSVAMAPESRGEVVIAINSDRSDMSYGTFVASHPVKSYPINICTICYRKLYMFDNRDQMNCCQRMFHKKCLADKLSEQEYCECPHCNKPFDDSDEVRQEPRACGGRMSDTCLRRWYGGLCYGSIFVFMGAVMGFGAVYHHLHPNRMRDTSS